MKQKLKFIDIFSGCGGLSFGLELAGLECLAAVDFNPIAIKTFNSNHSRPIGLERDLTKFEPDQLQETIGDQTIDLVVGGPPCQGFSTARSQGGANFGARLIEDPRRDLYKRFLKYVEFFKPKLFVMENVLGIKSAASGTYFTKIQEQSRSLGYTVVAIEINCWEFGVPQKRVRQLFIGTKKGMPLFMPWNYIKKTHSLNVDDNNTNPALENVVTLGEAIGDLPSLDAGTGSIESNYNKALREKHIKQYGDRYVLKEMRADITPKLTWHLARPHSARDLRDFLILKEGENSKQALARGAVMETPYSMQSFGDKYKRQNRESLCSTIVAHLKKDGLMFIHPTQNRSLTPREAARIQSFPDNFIFSGQRGNVYEQIGNAVPPLAGRAIGFAVNHYFSDYSSSSIRPIYKDSDRKLAIKKLEKIINNIYLGSIQQMESSEFMRAWNLIHITHPTIHPDSAFDTSSELEMPSNGVSLVISPFYKRTGWPKALIPIAVEALKRFKNKEISEAEYYFNSLEKS